MTKTPTKRATDLDVHYDSILEDITSVLEMARRSAARSVNCIMTAAYWLVGRRIVEYEQGGKGRAGYGEEILARLSTDLTAGFGRGFSRRNLQDMRLFYLNYPLEKIRQTLSAKSAESSPIQDFHAGEGPPPLPGKSDLIEKWRTVSAKFELADLAGCFPLPWSAYVRLLGVKNDQTRKFYETEALRGGWSVRQLDRQINSQFYERVALSKNKAAMLTKGQKAQPQDRMLPQEEIKDPFVLEFLGLKDEYSETELEEALILHLETFLLELGADH